MARRNDLADFLKAVAAESKAAGNERALEAYDEHFRLALEVIRLRRKNKWTQQQLARKSGVQQSEISRIERGQGNPTLQTLNALAQSGQMRVAFVSARTRRLKATRR